jgi:hypothetical protein
MVVNVKRGHGLFLQDHEHGLRTGDYGKAGAEDWSRKLAAEMGVELESARTRPAGLDLRP